MRVTTSTGVRTIATVTVRASATGACVRRGMEGWPVKPFSVPTTAPPRSSRESVTRWDDARLMRQISWVLCRWLNHSVTILLFYIRTFIWVFSVSRYQMSFTPKAIKQRFFVLLLIAGLATLELHTFTSSPSPSRPTCGDTHDCLPPCVMVSL